MEMTEKLIKEYLIKFSSEERYTDANMAILRTNKVF